MKTTKEIVSGKVQDDIFGSWSDNIKVTIEEIAEEIAEEKDDG